MACQVVLQLFKHIVPNWVYRAPHRKLQCKAIRRRRPPAYSYCSQLCMVVSSQQTLKIHLLLCLQKRGQYVAHSSNLSHCSTPWAHRIYWDCRNHRNGGSNATHWAHYRHRTHGHLTHAGKAIVDAPAVEDGIVSRPSFSFARVHSEADRIQLFFLLQGERGEIELVSHMQRVRDLEP